MYLYFLTSIYSSSFIEVVEKFDVLRTEVLQVVNIGQKYQKGGRTERKGVKTENPYLKAHLHININPHIYLQERSSNGLGGSAITNFFENFKGA